MTENSVQEPINDSRSTRRTERAEKVVKVTETPQSVEEPEPRRKKLVHVAPEEKAASPEKSPRREKPAKDPKVKNHVPEQLKGTMDPKAESKYNSMIQMLFGKK